MIVTYNGKKHSISRAYQGRFNETVKKIKYYKEEYELI